MLRSIILFLIIFLSSIHSFSQNRAIDSILKVRALAKDQNKPLEERLKYALIATELSDQSKIDSTILNSNRVLSRVYLFLGEYEPFVKLNHTNKRLAQKLKDTFATAIADNNLGFYHHIELKYDSAYYYYSNALKNYIKLNDLKSQGQILYNMADIQESEKDYIGSEENAIRAIKILQTLPVDKATLGTLWNAHNIVGIVALEIKLYDKSIEYHEKAIEIANKMQGGLWNKLASFNNIAYVYKKKGDFVKALEIYEDINTNNKAFFKLDPSFYALILDNIAFTKFQLGDTNYKLLEEQFKRAYKIADSIDDAVTKIAITIDLSRFYKAQNKRDSALHYANETYEISKETSTNDMFLESMIILSELNEGEKGKRYLNEYIKLSDSLLTNERAIKNKFTRIQFDTDQIELKNKEISRQKFWLMIFSGILIVTLFLLYIIITQRARNKELKFIQEQQETNEEIYNLMLSQQDKIDQGRAQEKRRISEELHDGILGRLFGTRLSLDSLNMSKTDEAMQTRNNYIIELKSIEEDIRKVSHDLNTDFVSGSGYMDIIKTLVVNQTKAYELAYDLNYNDDINWDDISNKTKIHIYRIIQESLQNIYKHANANEVKISFQLKNNVICLIISDNGSGFDVHKAKKGIGIKNITSRAKEIQGELNITSKKDFGTTITIKTPI